MLGSRFLSKTPTRALCLTPSRGYQIFKNLKRDEGKPGYTYVKAEKDLKILPEEELKEEIQQMLDGSGVDLISPLGLVPPDPMNDSEFKNILKDPIKAHVADMATHDYRFTTAKHFGSFKHRVQVSIVAGVMGGHEDEDFLAHMEDPEYTRSPVLDRIQLDDPEESDPRDIAYKIRPNLYDEMEIIEDESVPFKPTLTEEYNKGNLFYALGSDDPRLQQKLDYAKEKYDEATKYPGDPMKQLHKIRMWSAHMLDERALDAIIDEKKPRLNLGAREPGMKKISLEPLDSYDHYEDLVNDLLAKLVPDDGYLRLDPAWKWNAVEMGVHVLRADPFYVKPTCGFHFPDGLMVMRVAKFLKVRDRYLDPVSIHKELQRLTTRSWILEKYYNKEQTKKDEQRISYLRDGVKDRFLLINLRYGTFSVATYDEKVDPSLDEWNYDIDKVKNKYLSNAEIFEKTKTDSDHAAMDVLRLPTTWNVAIRKTPFPIFAGTGFTCPERRLHARMGILSRMQSDNSPLRADISEFVQNLPTEMDIAHPFINDLLINIPYEQFPSHQRA